MNTELTAEEIAAVLLGQMLDQTLQSPPAARPALLRNIVAAAGHVLGYFEAQLVLLGLTREEREDLRSHAILSGKHRALEDHDELCRACAAGTTLRSEVYPH